MRQWKARRSSDNAQAGRDQDDRFPAAIADAATIQAPRARSARPTLHDFRLRKSGPGMTEGRGGASVATGERDRPDKDRQNRQARERSRALAGARAFPPLMVVMFHFSEGHHYSGLRLVGFPGHPRLSVGGVLLRPVGLHPHPCLLAAAEGSVHRAGYLAFLRARLIRLYPLHLFMLLLILAMVVGLRALAASGRLSLDLRRQLSSRMSASRDLCSACFWCMPGTRMDTPDLERRLLVRQRRVRAVPVVSAVAWLAEGRLWRGFALIAAGLARPAGAAVHLQARAGHHLPQWRAARALSDFSVGVGLAVLFRRLKPRDRLPEWVHSAAADPAAVAAGLCGDAHRLVAHPHGHLHRAAA